MGSTTESLFPSAFSQLGSFASWVLADESARRGKCIDSSMEEITSFYDCMLASMDSILEHLNQFPLDALPEKEQNLMSLVLGFVEAAISVEMFEQPEVAFGVPVDRFRPLHHLVP
jgi:hypothetical protein